VGLEIDLHKVDRWADLAFEGLELIGEVMLADVAREAVLDGVSFSAVVRDEWFDVGVDVMVVSSNRDVDAICLVFLGEQ